MESFLRLLSYFKGYRSVTRTAEFSFPEDLRISNNILERKWSEYGELTELADRWGQIVPKLPAQATEAGSEFDVLNCIEVINLPAHPYETHQILSAINMRAGHMRRKENNLFRKCSEWTAYQHIQQHPNLVAQIEADDEFPETAGDYHMQIDAYKFLAMSLAERSKFDDAIDICNLAIERGIDDGTQGGFAGRIEKIKRKAKKHKSSEIDIDDWDYRCTLQEYHDLLAEVREVLLEEKANVHHLGAPYLKEHWFASQQMNEEQQSFYKQWKKSWKSGTAIQIEGVSSYIKSYMRHEVLKLDPQKAINELLRLSESYSSDIQIKFDSLNYAYQFYLLLGDLHGAFSLIDQMHPQEYFAMKFILGKPISGRDILTKFDQPVFTDWGKENLEQVIQHADRIVEGQHPNLLDQWIVQKHDTRGIFPGTSLRQSIDIPTYQLPYWSRNVQMFKNNLARDAENAAREEIGLPKVGEGWVSETQLYYEIKEAFAKLKVIHHGSPRWLGRQHLDIYIPEIKVAVEYQGLQHDEPVEFFGGEESFQENQERDARKAQLCDKHGVHLIYVRPGYDLEEIVTEIRQFID